MRNFGETEQQAQEMLGLIKDDIEDVDTTGNQEPTEDNNTAIQPNS